MFKTVSDKQKICSYICALLMLFMLYALTMPFWHYNVLPDEMSSEEALLVEQKFHDMASDALILENADEPEEPEVLDENGEVVEVTPADKFKEAYEMYVSQADSEALKNFLKEEYYNFTYANDADVQSPWKTEHSSIFGYIWSCKTNQGFADWYNNQFGTDYTPEQVADEVVVFPIWMLLVTLAACVLCFVQPKFIVSYLLTIVSGVLCIIAYETEPVFKLGLIWKLHYYLSIAGIFFAVIATIFAVYDKFIKSSSKRSLSGANLTARIEAIKSLGNVTEGMKSDEINKNFHILLNTLHDPIPECRIAATETLASTTREVAITHISHNIDIETDERVIKAMRKALVEIRENVHKENS